MSKPSIWEILFDKDEINEAKKRNREFRSQELSGSISPKMKRMLSSRFFRFTKAASYLFSHISTKVYGAALLCFGLLGSIIYFLGVGADDSIANPIIGLLCALISIPLLLSDKPMPILLQDFRPTDYIFFDFFCIKRHTVRECDRRVPIWLATAVGLVLALLSVLIPLWVVALIIGIIVLVYLGMESPECIYILTLFSLPFLRYLPSYDIILSAALLFATISFAVKVSHGKRVLNIEQYDMLLGAMLILILISGIFVKGIESFSGSVRMITLAFGYTLAGNIITNRRLAELSANAIAISGVAASVVSLIQLVIALSGSDGEITNEILSPVLSRSDGVAVFLMASVVFAVGFAAQHTHRRRVLYIIAAFISLVGLILSGEVFAVTSLLLGLVAYAVIKTNKLPWLFMPILLVLSVVFLTLPYGVLDALFNFSPSIVSAKELFALWNGSIKAFANNMLVGIGIGKESFAMEMEGLGIFGYPDSSNLFIELGLEAGIFALICFVLLLICRLRHRALHYNYVKNSELGRMANLSGVCILSLLAFGMVNYIWSEPSAYYLFWCIFGIGSASLRVAKNDYNDRVVYYEESSAYDSSVIDIEIG